MPTKTKQPPPPDAYLANISAAFAAAFTAHALPAYDPGAEVTAREAAANPALYPQPVAESTARRHLEALVLAGTWTARAVRMGDGSRATAYRPKGK
jgi:hypothetical protein